jgi:uncharacterized membrane protein
MAVSTHRDHPAAGKKPSIAPTLLLGLGLGGFIDGIVLVLYRRGSRVLDLQARPTRPFRG